MKLMTDKPFELKRNFICMGIITDSDKAYACILQLKPFNLYIEEIHWGPGHNIETSTLHIIDNDKEWGSLYNFATTNTTIFSPKKIKEIIKKPELYFYTSKYRKSNDFGKRKQNKIL